MNSDLSRSSSDKAWKDANLGLGGLMSDPLKLSRTHVLILGTPYIRSKDPTFSSFTLLKKPLKSYS